MEVVMHTKLSPDECVSRMEAALGNPSTSMVDIMPFLVCLVGDERPPVFGIIEGHEFQIKKRRYFKSPGYAFIGSIEPEANTFGSKIICRSGTPIREKKRLYLFGIVWLLFAIRFLPEIINGWNKRIDSINALLALFVFPIGLTIITLLNKAIGKMEEPTILDFLQTNLEASVIQKQD